MFTGPGKTNKSFTLISNDLPLPRERILPLPMTMSPVRGSAPGVTIVPLARRTGKDLEFHPQADPEE
jgi:hypothetical protein